MKFVGPWTVHRCTVHGRPVKSCDYCSCTVYKQYHLLGKRREKKKKEGKRRNLKRGKRESKLCLITKNFIFFFWGRRTKNFNEPKRKKQNLFHQPNDTRPGSQSFFFFLRSQSSLFIDFFFKVYIFIVRLKYQSVIWIEGNWTTNILYSTIKIFTNLVNWNPLFKYNLT